MLKVFKSRSCGRLVDMLLLGSLTVLHNFNLHLSFLGHLLSLPTIPQTRYQPIISRRYYLALICHPYCLPYFIWLRDWDRIKVHLGITSRLNQEPEVSQKSKGTRLTNVLGDSMLSFSYFDLTFDADQLICLLTNLNK